MFTKRRLGLGVLLCGCLLLWASVLPARDRHGGDRHDNDRHSGDYHDNDHHSGDYHDDELDMDIFGGDLDKVSVMYQEEPLVETGNPNGNVRDLRLTQEQAEAMDYEDLLKNGKRIFTTTFVLPDGLGDGPTNSSENYRDQGGRAGLQKAFPFVRVNGMDAQSCLECHAVMRNSTIPFTPGIGGMAGAATNVIFKPSAIDVSGVSPSAFDGRFINPVNLPGRGGIELLSKEMTADLQKLKVQAKESPGTVVELTTHDVDFGTLTHDGSDFDYSGVKGIDNDLILKPFGRKAEFNSVRGFDVNALSFHFGMEAVELAGSGIDKDGDGVADELLTGDVSVLGVFVTNLPRPFIDKAANRRKLNRGMATFKDIGCAKCHIPVLYTQSRKLTYSYPEVPEDPAANVFFSVDLSKTVGFPRVDKGLAIPLFTDLKYHEMGENLSESLDLPGLENPDKFNRRFRTPDLMGVRDSAPYLHDGRAGNIRDAILTLDGEAKEARDAFAALSEDKQNEVLYLLDNMRNPIIH